MLAFLQNINPSELVVIAIVAILIFGRRLPEVAGKTAAQMQRARRAFNDLKRESGIDDELRQARRAFDQAQAATRVDPRKLLNTPKIEPPRGGAAVPRNQVPPATAPNPPVPPATPASTNPPAPSAATHPTPPPSTPPTPPPDPPS
jgi:Sec-independent protein translocase protein TatA